VIDFMVTEAIMLKARHERSEAEIAKHGGKVAASLAQGGVAGHRDPEFLDRHRGG
jgi:hypothetical protein